jgi:polyphosphate glucokinase
VNVLAIDVGGTNIKVLATGESEPRRFPSGPKMTPKQMVKGVKQITKDWKYDAISIGYPGRVFRDRPVAEPHNLARGWVGFNFKAAFGHPVKLINDAAMQALGSYKNGTLLFLGLGTGLGSALVHRTDGIGPPVLQEGDIRRLRRPPRLEATGKEEMGTPRGIRSGPPDRRPLSRRRGYWGW